MKLTESPVTKEPVKDPNSFIYYAYQSQKSKNINIYKIV